MSEKIVSVGLSIDGDASGAVRALSETEKELLAVRDASEKIILLEGAEERAKELASKMQAAQQEVSKLETALSEAFDFGANDKTIDELSGKLAAAEREAGKLAKSIASNGEQLAKLRVEARLAGIDVSRLGDEKNRIEQAAQAAAGLSRAFNTLGVKPLRAVLDETERLRAALATIKASGLPFEDKERAIAAFNEKLAALRKEVAQVPGATAAANTGLASVATGANSAGAALGSAAKSAALAIAALTGLNGIGDIAKDIVNTGAAFETLEVRLTSLLGSSDAAKEAMGQIKQLAITTPFEVSALSDSFVKLTAFGLQPSMEQMRALSDTAATLGGGTEVLAGVTLALGQAWAKGKLQGEEIMQLAERGVPVWDVLAKATGKNTAELQKMSEAGELGRGTILKLIDALGQVNAGASEKLMATFSGAVSNAKDALAEFYDMVAKAGVLEFLTGQLQDLLAEFDRMKQSGELQAEAKRLADSFVAFGEGVRTAVEAVNALSGTIKLGVEVWVAWRLAGMTLIPVLAGVGRQAAVAAAETTALAAASNSAAVASGRLATALRLVKGLTLVGLIEGAVSLGVEFFRAKKAAEDGDRAIKKMFEPVPVNGPEDSIRAVVTETEAARFKLTEYQRALAEMQSQGKTTGEALGEMVKKADLSGVKGIVDMLNGLRSIEQGAMATGKQIQESIQDRLNKMTAGDLRDFGIMAKSAFDQGRISADQLAATLNGQVDAALKGLGSSLEVSAGGMTAKFIEVSQQIGVVEASYDRLKETGQNAGAVLKAAFEGGLNTAKSIEDLEGLAASIRQAGEAGRLSKKEVADFLDTIRTKVDEIKPGINSLAEAFKTLGMKSPEELKKVAKSAEDAFNIIKQGSGYSKAELANVSEAFKRYAEAAIAANGGVASDTLRVKAELYGLRIEADASGKAMIKMAEDTSTAATSADKAANSYQELADSLTSVDDAANRAASSLDNVSSNAFQSPSTAIDFAGLAMRRGAKKEDAAAIQEAASKIFSDELNKNPTRDSSPERSKAYISSAVNEAMRQLADATQRNEQDSAVSRPDTLSQPSQNRGRSELLPPPSEPQKTIRIELTHGANRSTVFSENDSSAESFIRVLESAGMRASR